MPPCEPPGGCLGFFAAVQGFFNAICAWLRDMAFKQGTEQARLLYPLYEEAGSFHSESEQTSGQMATTANRHGMNSTNNEHVILYPVMDRQFVFIAVSDTVAVICKGGGTVRRIPKNQLCRQSANKISLKALQDILADC